MLNKITYNIYFFNGKTEAQPRVPRHNSRIMYNTSLYNLHSHEKDITPWWGELIGLSLASLVKIPGSRAPIFTISQELLDTSAARPEMVGLRRQVWVTNSLSPTLGYHLGSQSIPLVFKDYVMWIHDRVLICILTGTESINCRGLARVPS